MGEASRIVVAEYSPGWPIVFATERAGLLMILTGGTYVIEHIGSTAVPGLAAKPVIDILVGAESLPAIERHIPELVARGYAYIAEYEATFPDRRYLERLEAGVHTVHVHAVQRDSPFWQEHLAFRDALRADRRLAIRYGDLKRRLAADLGHDRQAYTDAKSSFIQSVLSAVEKKLLTRESP